MLSHVEPGTGIALDLLEWLQPRPLPAPERTRLSLGMSSLGFDVPDLEAARRRIADAGGQAAAATERSTLAGDAPTRWFAAWDPDGLPLVVREAERARLTFVDVTCSELERSLRFYDEVLGLKAVWVGDAPHLGRDWQQAALALPGDASGFRVALCPTQDRDAEPARVEPHRLGLFRMALLSTDIGRAHAELRGLGVAGLSEVADLDLGPACPAPRCRALFFRDPDGACLELIEVPQAASATPPPARA
jgi:catechol 2,3-dioxygenase-like lactoylglutathione lyase family enzyme